MNYHTLARARDGDIAAIEEVVKGLRPRLSRMAIYYARSCRQEADDLLSEAWKGMLEALSELNLNIGDPEQYLIKYARWRLLDAIRDGQARQSLNAADTALDSFPCSAQSNALDDIELIDFFRMLKPFQQSISICLIAGMTWRETGKLLGCTSANVAYHVKQIRRIYTEWINV